MKITNKLESVNMIYKLNLNRFPEKLFKKGEEEQVKQFLKDFPAKYYALRDKKKARGIFKLSVPKENLLEEIKDYEIYTINVSSVNYEKNQILGGEIFIGKDNEVHVMLSTSNKATGREEDGDIYNYNWKTNLFDKRLKEIPKFDQIYEYIVNHQLIDVIVEFSYFDIPVGINQENIIIWELRTDY